MARHTAVLTVDSNLVTSVLVSLLRVPLAESCCGKAASFQVNLPSVCTTRRMRPKAYTAREPVPTTSPCPACSTVGPAVTGSAGQNLLVQSLDVVRVSLHGNVLDGLRGPSGTGPPMIVVGQPIDPVSQGPHVMR